MKIKNSELQMLLPALSELAGLKTNFKVGYAVSKTIRKVEAAAKDYDTARQSIMKGFCKKDEKGNPEIKENKFVFETPEVESNAIEEVAKLMDLEVEVAIYSLPEKDFELIEDLTPSLIYRLDKLIEETPA